MPITIVVGILDAINKLLMLSHAYCTELLCLFWTTGRKDISSCTNHILQIRCNGPHHSLNHRTRYSLHKTPLNEAEISQYFQVKRVKSLHKGDTQMLFSSTFKQPHSTSISTNFITYRSGAKLSSGTSLLQSSRQVLYL